MQRQNCKSDQPGRFEGPPAQECETAHRLGSPGGEATFQVRLRDKKRGPDCAWQRSDLAEVQCEGRTPQSRQHAVHPSIMTLPGRSSGHLLWSLVQRWLRPCTAGDACQVSCAGTIGPNLLPPYEGGCDRQADALREVPQCMDDGPPQIDALLWVTLQTPTSLHILSHTSC